MLFYNPILALKTSKVNIFYSIFSAYNVTVDYVNQF